MSPWNPTESELVGLLPATGRGPKREAIYALWLVARIAQDLLLDPPLAERAVRRRFSSLDARLSSLTLPPPLRRALAGALEELRTRGASAVPVALGSLVAPARETAGAEAGEALQRAARAARQSLASLSR